MVDTVDERRGCVDKGAEGADQTFGFWVKNPEHPVQSVFVTDTQLHEHVPVLECQRLSVDL